LYSCFRIQACVLKWFTSYLSSRFFMLNVIIVFFLFACTVSLKVLFLVIYSLSLCILPLSVPISLLELSTLCWWHTTFLLLVLIPQKQNFSSLVSNNNWLSYIHSVRNLGFIFDEHLTLSNQISALFKSCYSHIRSTITIFCNNFVKPHCMLIIFGKQILK